VASKRQEARDSKRAGASPTTAKGSKGPRGGDSSAGASSSPGGLTAEQEVRLAELRAILGGSGLFYVKVKRTLLEALLAAVDAGRLEVERARQVQMFPEAVARG
jgi:hypothetical protein